MTPQPASESDELAKLRRENAAWRRKFREAEDALRAQADEVRRYQHAELERVATELRFHDAADALGFLDRQELFGDGGRIDVEKAKRALSSLASSKPCLVQPFELLRAQDASAVAARARGRTAAGRDPARAQGQLRGLRRPAGVEAACP